jgi:GMP synthase-like glutamine amidotransferase
MTRSLYSVKVRVDRRVGEQIVASNHDDDIDEDDDETVDNSSVENKEVDRNIALSEKEEIDFSLQAHNVHTADDTSLPPEGENLAHEESETKEPFTRVTNLNAGPMK